MSAPQGVAIKESLHEQKHDCNVGADEVFLVRVGADKDQGLQVGRAEAYTEHIEMKSKIMSDRGQGPNRLIGGGSVVNIHMLFVK